jgi:hypothetical protein
MNYSVKQILCLVFLILGFYHLNHADNIKLFATDMAAMIYFGFLSIVEAIELKK